MTATPSYLRFPHLVGDRLVFAADDDVWLASGAGGLASRLTADRCPVSRPRLSPDGATVAWLSRRAGVPEAFALPVGGGPVRQLSHLGDERVQLLGFLPDGRLVLSSSAGRPSRDERWGWALDPAEAEPVAQPLPYGPINGITVSSNGAVLVGNGSGKDPAHWKRYRGGNAGRLWLAPAGGADFVPLLPELPGPKTDPVAVGDRFAFLADFEGHQNVYSVDAGGGDLRRHTDHDRYYARQLAGDGQRLVYQHAGEIWLIEDLAADGRPRRLPIELPGGRAGREPFVLLPGPHLGDYAVDGSGRASALEVRGMIVWLTHRNGPARAVAAEPGVRHRLPTLIGEPTGPGLPAIGYVTSADGPDSIELAAPDGEVRRFGAGQVGRVLELVAAPDGRRLAVATHDGRLLVLSVADGTLTELLANPHGDVSGLAWSPDSAWLACSVPEATPETRSIRLCELATGRVTPVTRERFVDTDPTFSPDGDYLAFLSVRTFDPVYDAQVFDLSFAAASRPYLVPLAADTPSPFDPELAGQPVGGPPAAGDQAGEGQPGARPVRVDLDGIADRVVPFPVRAGRYVRLHAVAGGFVWAERPIAGELGESRRPGDDVRPSLQLWDLAKRTQVELAAHHDDARPSGDGTRLVLRDREALRLVPAGRSATAEDPEVVEIDLDRIRLTIDPAAEWAQMLAETGQLMREHYWHPALGDLDWDAAVDKYRQLVPALATRDDLADLIWELNGETATSHAYFMPVPAPPGPAAPAFLGADLGRDPDGSWRVHRVVPGDNSARAARAPLAAPAVNVRAGDMLLAVNGRPVGGSGPAPLLRGTADKPVELLVARDGRRRSVVVTPLPDELELRYLDWVAGRRRLAREASGGRIGYLHVPDMMSAGWAAFHRDLAVEMGRDALIVDTRGNGGGHTSQLILEKLSRRVIGWTTARHRSPSSYPSAAPLGPVVSLADQWAGSDGDIVNAAFQSLGLGPVIGERTWGGVIGIDGRYRLVDGSRVTQPRYAFWLERFGWGVENYGIEPDQVVPTPPQAWAAGADPVLQAGIDHLLAELERRPAPARPDPAGRPSLRAPELPPRP
ncbi:MAG TPA: S41 family peptidase [Jatrophihabitans sp.]|nr:S41 family peptidase [Jatrophihabitans sp.]